jgi:hypothetical protein
MGWRPAIFPSEWAEKWLRPEGKKAAGIDQLTPEQQAALGRLAQRFTQEGARKEVEVVKAQAQVETAEAVKKVQDDARAEKSEAMKKRARRPGPRTKRQPTRAKSRTPVSLRATTTRSFAPAFWERSRVGTDTRPSGWRTDRSGSSRPRTSNIFQIWWIPRSS